ncbi:MAG: hypothetical protein HQL56_12080 [Magnetococcales bacterium]|nr:hypothetical protein [Magnetococcales bacterium]
MTQSAYRNELENDIRAAMAQNGLLGKATANPEEEPPVEEMEAAAEVAEGEIPIVAWLADHDEEWRKLSPAARQRLAEAFAREQEVAPYRPSIETLKQASAFFPYMKPHELVKNAMMLEGAFATNPHHTVSSLARHFGVPTGPESRSAQPSPAQTRRAEQANPDAGGGEVADPRLQALLKEVGALKGYLQQREAMERKAHYKMAVDRWRELFEAASKEKGPDGKLVRPNFRQHAAEILKYCSIGHDPATAYDLAEMANPTTREAYRKRIETDALRKAGSASRTKGALSGKVLGGSPSNATADLEPAETLEEEVRRAMAMHMNLHV